MTGSELRAIRLALGLSQKEFAHALGLAPSGESSPSMSRLEAQPIVPAWTARLAKLYSEHGCPERFD